MRDILDTCNENMPKIMLRAKLNYLSLSASALNLLYRHTIQTIKIRHVYYLENTLNFHLSGTTNSNSGTTNSHLTRISHTSTVNVFIIGPTAYLQSDDSRS